MISTEEANDEIAKIIVDEWEAHRRPLLISKLGMLVSPDAKLALAETGHGLKRYIEENLEKRVRLVPMRGRGGGAVPLEETKIYSDAQVEDLYVRRTDDAADQPPVPMYWGDVWRGFQTELADGSVRYLRLEASGGPEVADAPEGAPLPAHARLIERNDLVLAKQGEPRPPRMSVHQAIENWCRRVGVPLDSVKFERAAHPRRAEPSVEPRRRPVDRSIRPNGRDRDTIAALVHAMDLLSRDELARINVPADLVLAILERSGSR